MLATRSLSRLLAAAVTSALLLGACASPEASGGGNQGKEGAKVPERVTMVIPYAEGGGTDTWARFLAPYLGKHVAGGPSVTPKNVPGGESITGSNQFVTQGGTDGQQILATSGTTYFQYLLGRKEVEFDFSKMKPLILNGTGGVIYVSKASGITSLQDLKKPPKQLTYGGISATGLDLSVLLAFELLGLNVKTTFGFEGRGPARLALERGEVNIDYQTTSAYHTQVEPMVSEGKAIPLMSFGVLDSSGKVVRDPNLPELPTVEEAYQQLNGKAPQGEVYDAYQSFFAAGFVYQKGIWANEGTPDSICDAYYDAVTKLRDNAEFKDKGKEVLGGYDLYAGRDVAEQVKKAFTVDEKQRAFVLKLLETKYNTKVETK